MDKKTILRISGIILAAASLIICCTVSINGLDTRAVRTLGVLLAALFLLITEAFNVCVSCMFASAALYVFGCTDSINQAFGGYSNHILYFTTASFGLSFAFRKSGLGRRLLGTLMRRGKLTVKRVTLSFMVCAAVLSAIMSNVAAAVIFLPFADMYLDFYSDKTVKKETRKSMFICITVSVLIGGMMSPAGSSMNLICMDMLEKYAGGGITFAEWMMIGIPTAAVMLICAFFIITKVYPLKEPEESEMAGYEAFIREKQALNSRDIYTACVIVATLILWLLSSWFPKINVTATAISALVMFFLPKVHIMTWEEFSGSISWATFFIAGTLISIADAVVKTGLSSFFAEKLFPKGNFSEIATVAVAAAVTFVFMAVLPSAPAVITILSPLIIDFAVSCGHNPAMVLTACGLCVSNIYLFPLDAPLAAAYDKKAFGMFDLPKATVWLQLIMILLVSVWVPFIFRLMF